MYSKQEEKIAKSENNPCIDSKHCDIIGMETIRSCGGDYVAVIKVNFDKLAEIQGDMSNTAFMETIGMDGSYLYKIKKGETEVGKDFVANLLSKYQLKFEEVFYLAEPSQGSKAREVRKCATQE
jgi:hypothetical protein